MRESVTTRLSTAGMRSRSVVQAEQADVLDAAGAKVEKEAIAVAEFDQTGIACGARRGSDSERIMG